jgi:mannan endo-1,4-beta-mannosidase
MKDRRYTEPGIRYYPATTSEPGRSLTESNGREQRVAERSTMEEGTRSIPGAHGGGRHRGASLRVRNLMRYCLARLAALIGHDQHAADPESRSVRGGRDRMKLTWIMAIGAAVITVAAVVLVVVLHGKSAGSRTVDPDAPTAASRPLAPGSYLGVYEPGVPDSYAGIKTFAASTGVQPTVIVYYSGWLEKFQAGFATLAARHDAVPLVQINPEGVSIKAIASGHYDPYLRSYASAVKAFGRHVIISFGHEMNGSWYSWGYQHTAPAVFVAAWRHIVTVFRQVGADNVTWLWTINISECRCRIDSPEHWWPGSSYVNWVGIDGYYYQPSWKFASLFGPTIKAVRRLTLDPILISETAAPAAIQPAKISNLFRGIRAYGLLGFVWFDVDKGQPYEDWRISSPAAFTAFRRGAETLKKSTP